MKTKTKIWICPLALIGVLLMLTSYSNKKNDNNPNSKPTDYYIGQNYGGGIIFYIDSTGQHGLIAATADQSKSMQWGCQGSLIPVIFTAIGTGQANTTTILNVCPTPSIAARICDQYSETVDGVTYDDWFLPSKDELYLLYQQKTIVGGFATYSLYWSSSQYNANYAWGQGFGNGSQSFNTKGYTTCVRAIRAF
jgi:hypothetical protein